MHDCGGRGIWSNIAVGTGPRSLGVLGPLARLALAEAAESVYALATRGRGAAADPPQNPSGWWGLHVFRGSWEKRR